MLKIEIKTISHKDQRYDTVGDYFDSPDGGQHFRISDLGNEYYESLVMIHELIEDVLRKKRGITNEQIDAFDKAYPANGKYSDDPGCDPHAPYHREHMFAIKLEKMICKELKISWKDYEASFDQLPEWKKQEPVANGLIEA